MKVTVTVIVGFFLIFLLIAIQETRLAIKYKPYEKELSLAQGLREDGDLSEAKKLLTVLTQKQPEEPAGFIELSYTYEDMGILDSALNEAEIALGKTRHAMGKGNLFLNRLRLLRWKENLEQRIQDLPLAIQGQEAIRIWSTGDQDGALAKLLELVSKYPAAYQPHAAMSVLYKNKGDNEKSIQEAETGLTKIALQLKSKKMTAQMKTLVEQDKRNLQDAINELRVLYSED